MALSSRRQAQLEAEGDAAWDAHLDAISHCSEPEPILPATDAEILQAAESMLRAHLGPHKVDRDSSRIDRELGRVYVCSIEREGYGINRHPKYELSRRIDSMGRLSE